LKYYNDLSLNLNLTTNYNYYSYLHNDKLHSILLGHNTIPTEKLITLLFLQFNMYTHEIKFFFNKTIPTFYIFKISILLIFFLLNAIFKVFSAFNYSSSRAIKSFQKTWKWKYIIVWNCINFVENVTHSHRYSNRPIRRSFVCDEYYHWLYILVFIINGIM